MHRTVPMNPEEFRRRMRFVVSLGRALHECGAASERIERHLANVTEMLGLKSSILISPTTFTCAFWEEDELDQVVHIERVEPADYNMGRLWEIDRMVESMDAREINFAEALDRLDELSHAKRHYSTACDAFAWMLGGGAFAALLSPNSLDAIVASALSLGSFLVARFCGARPGWRPVLTILAAFVAGVFASLLSALGLGINTPFVILSAIIIFIPGLALTVALTEISTGHLISGSSRLVDAAMSMLKLFFGAVSGMAVVHFFGGVPVAEPLVLEPMPPWRIWPALLALSLVLGVAFNTPPKKVPLGVLAAGIAFGGSRAGELWIGMYAGMFIGALAVGLYSNLFARITKGPGSILIIHGVILLVPGSKVYMILNHWVSGENILPEVSGGSQAMMVFAALVAGLLFSQALLPSRKSL